jgi:colanic acid/amylovoran biosynthesis protein
LYPALKICLPYPRVIFVRERQGLEYLLKFTKSNVKQSCDVVLQARGIEKTNIFSENVPLKDFHIKMNSVAIIPNMRVVDRMQREKFYAIYESLMSTLLHAGYTVYIVKHSDEDSQVCRSIKHLFDGDQDVILVEDELNAIELEIALAKFIFIIASRYHSIIHAYKKGVPAVVIGWAKKYSELLQEFGQEAYYCDGRDDAGLDAVIPKLKRMMERWQEEKEKIAGRLAALSAQTVFDHLVNDLADSGEKTVSNEFVEEFTVER